MKQRFYFDTSVFGGVYDIEFDAKVKTTEKEFDTVKTFRAIKEKISKDISQMTLAQIKEYLQQQKLNTPISI
jgi:hypothetical protein